MESESDAAAPDTPYMIDADASAEMVAEALESGEVLALSVPGVPGLVINGSPPAGAGDLRRVLPHRLSAGLRLRCRAPDALGTARIRASRPRAGVWRRADPASGLRHRGASRSHAFGSQPGSGTDARARHPASGKHEGRPAGGAADQPAGAVPGQCLPLLRAGAGPAAFGPRRGADYPAHAAPPGAGTGTRGACRDAA